KAPAGVAVKPSPKPPASVAVKPSPAAVEPQSAIARAKDITGPPPKGAGGSASSLSGGEIDRRANANLDNPGRRRYLIAAGIALLVLFAGAGGYGLGRRNRSREIGARLVEVRADARAVPVESSTGAPVRITSNR